MLLGVALAAAVASGLASWGIGTRWAGTATAVHGVAGLSLLVLAPAKLRGSVRAGFRRRRPGRWISTAFGALLLGAIALGALHATGAWHGIGYWSALWSHVLTAAVLLPLAVWHVLSRRGRPRRTDLDRRTLLAGGAAAAIGAAVYAGVEATAGSDRRHTGSYEIASFSPAGVPVVQWLNDSAPPVPSSGWDLSVFGRPVEVEALRSRAGAVEAVLDCTGGWFTRQSWTAVPLDEVLEMLDVGAVDARSVNVTSATGYSRLFPGRDTANLYLATGYGRETLRRGHGGPVRLVAPGRRGFWWVKWVTRIEPDRRPWWLQLPFPLE